MMTTLPKQNIFKAQFEKHNIYWYIKNKSTLYLQYIDDMDRNNQELLVFLEILKSNRNTITFDHNILHSSISFLDKLISKG